MLPSVVATSASLGLLITCSDVSLLLAIFPLFYGPIRTHYLDQFLGGRSPAKPGTEHVVPCEHSGARAPQPQKIRPKKSELPPTHESIPGEIPRSDRSLQRRKTVLLRRFTAPCAHRETSEMETHDRAPAAKRETGRQGGRRLEGLGTLERRSLWVRKWCRIYGIA